jgi:hypothetical protein
VEGRGSLFITVEGVIAAGPKAVRTAVSFFKDGEYQEQMFRKVEAHRSNIYHLGNWHTHHVNGLETLSRGDCQTYRKHVESQNHATDFWYAFLVTTKRLGWYTVKHFILFRGDGAVHELRSLQMSVIDGRNLVECFE